MAETRRKRGELSRDYNKPLTISVRAAESTLLLVSMNVTRSTKVDNGLVTAFIPDSSSLIPSANPLSFATISPNDPNFRARNLMAHSMLFPFSLSLSFLLLPRYQ